MWLQPVGRTTWPTATESATSSPGRGRVIWQFQRRMIRPQLWWHWRGVVRWSFFVKFGEISFLGPFWQWRSLSGIRSPNMDRKIQGKDFFLKLPRLFLFLESWKGLDLFYFQWFVGCCRYEYVCILDYMHVHTFIMFLIDGHLFWFCGGWVFGDSVVFFSRLFLVASVCLGLVPGFCVI